MRITFDPAKRAETLKERKLDFADAALVFGGKTVLEEDRRWDYGEVPFPNNRISGGADSGDRLDTARGDPPHHLDEALSC